jgi:hypothetical protein
MVGTTSPSCTTPLTCNLQVLVSLTQSKECK